MIDVLVVPGLSEDDNDVLNACLWEIRAKAVINRRRTNYFDAKQVTRHLGIAIPPQLESVETVIGWPAKSVEELETRIDLDGFVLPGADAASVGLDRVWADNRLGIESTQAHTSSLKYGVSFLAVMAGGAGEPDVVVRNLSPTSSTVLWDANRRRAAAGLSIITSEAGYPTEFILYLADKIVTCVFSRGRWRVDEEPHNLGRCPVAVLPYKPSTESPLGRSRISQSVMSITDRAVRSLLRMEVSAEFYSSPQRYVLGADEKQFQDRDGNTIPQWVATISRFMAIPFGEDGQKPEVGQFPQLTMEPHMGMVRNDAALLAGETNIPVNALGIIHDNPSSDAAMHTAYLALNKAAERAHAPFGAGWVDAMQMAVMVRDGLSSVPDELTLLQAKWRDPATPTKQAATQAVVEQVREGILPPDSEVTLEQLGYDATTIQRLLSDRRRAQAGSRLTELVEAARAARGGVNGDTGAGQQVPVE